MRLARYDGQYFPMPNIDKNAEIETRILVTSSEFLSPIYLPKKPEIIDAAKGRNKIESSIFNLLIYLFPQHVWFPSFYNKPL